MKQWLKQRLWKYRGHRIRPSDYHAVLRSGIGIFIPVFLLMLLVYFWESFTGWRDWFQVEAIIRPQDWEWSFILIGMLIAVLVGGLVVAIAYFCFYRHFQHVWHEQKLARMLISNRFLEKEQKTMDSMWSLTEKKVTKEKITYFPRAYYRVKRGYILVRIALDMSRFQDRFLHLGEDLENGLYCNLVEREVEENFVKYTLLYDMQKNRIPIKQVTVENGAMRLMDNVYWKFDKMPHMLIAGGTGGGKTYFILTLIEALLTSGADVRILDPKRADLADLETVMPEKTVFSKSAGIMMTLRKSVEEMLQRSEDMKQMPSYQTGSNYADVGLPPVFIVFDEFVAFMEMLDPKEKMQALEYMKQLVMLGRQMGYFLILAAQRPDAKYLADGIRDQFSFRVALGKMSESGYGMMFGDVDKTFSYKGIKGRGYADTGTSVITEFYTPLVPRGYDFLKKIGRASGEGSERRRRQSPTAV
ncbi:FtsK/SpoIIIE domain-containing protein [Virgibacillus salidurans]|uniref:FtsK/SpoIIIE domain-containing protein n=1 Tax=Virgibacillus salidurans TaxID=2831673 RepID=UPI00351D20E3